MNFLTFTYAATGTQSEILISGRETFDLRLARKLDNISSKEIYKNINNFSIKATININNNTVTFSGRTTIGNIYTHNC